MLGAKPLEAILGSGVDSTNHDAMRSFVRAACSEGLSLLLILPNSKQPADMRTPRQRTADDKAVRLQAKEAGRHDWERVRSPSGLALASTDAKTVLKYLDRYCDMFSKWHDLTDDGVLVDFDAKRAKAGEIEIIEPVAVNLAVEVGGSGRVVVDCDTREQLGRFLEVSQAPSDMPPTVTSPGQRNVEGVWAHKDGGHFWFTVPDEVIPILPRNSGALTWGGDHGFAVLWERRYVLIPPSCRPEGCYELTGREYELPEWLSDAIIEHGEARFERSVGNREAFTDSDDALSKAIDSWAESASWADILEPLGWTPAPRSDGCGCAVWSAPGQHASPKSATAHDSGCSLGRYTEVNCPLHIWTDHDAPPFTDDIGTEGWSPTFSKLQAVARIDYGGNIGKAMDELGLTPDLGIGADMGVGPARDIGDDADVSMGNLREADDGEIETVDRLATAQDGRFDQWPSSESPAAHESAYNEAEHGENWCVPCGTGTGIFVTDPEDGNLYHAVDDDDASESGHLAQPVIASENGVDHISADQFDLAGALPERDTKRIEATQNESPFADRVDNADPDVFESGMTGVPRIAPFSHWRDLPPPEFVIDGLIEHGGFSCLIGPPGVGKSTVALDMACHIATGRRWQGRQTLKTKIMYMPGEGLSGAIQRLIAWCDARGIDESDLSENLLLADSILQLAAKNEAWAEFGAYVARQQVGLIIFDTFARMSLRLEENSATDVGLAVGRFDNVRKLTNAGVMVIHHTAKGQDFARGSSALNGAIESELLLKHGEWDYTPLLDADGKLPGRPIQLTTSKQRNAEQLDEPLPLMMRSYPLPDSDELTAAIITGPNGEIDPMSGEIVLARPVAEPLVETAIRIREFVDRLPQQGASRSELVIGVRPDPYALSRADAGAYWKLRIGEAVDRALRYRLIETLTGTPSGGRYIPCSLGTSEDARQRTADEVINQNNQD
jgi:hypothetical protein